jgi:hypothetical protein
LDKRERSRGHRVEEQSEGVPHEEEEAALEEDVEEGSPVVKTRDEEKRDNS